MGSSVSVGDIEGDEDTKVDIIEGVLATVKSDVIVNSSNTALLLDYGGMSKALVRAAGRSMLAESARKYPNGIEFGDVAVTSGHKLTCKEVFHIALPEWGSKYANSLELLQSTVSKCLEEAESRGMQSIAFPALGCGFLNYPHDIVAQTMHYCLNKFKITGGTKHLRQIIICIWPHGADWKHIKEAFLNEALEDRQTMPSVRLQDLEESLQKRKNSCQKVLQCGHACRGYKDEQTCPPCLRPNCAARDKTHTDRDDCAICFTDPLSAAPVVQLQCCHVFHLHCVRRVLENRWIGARVTFNFTHCPLCKAPMQHEGLKDLLTPICELYSDVERKALMRLQFEGLQSCPEVVSQSSPYFNNPAKYAMDRYCYYLCSKCQKSYFGGAAHCEGGAEAPYRAEDLVCPSCCSPFARDQVCNKHGTDFIEYKCRYCCTIAVFFCFGTTHFCNQCHNNVGRVTSMGDRLPQCPAGPVGQQLSGSCPLGIQHPPNGTEFCLGCGLCSNLQTF